MKLRSLVVAISFGLVTSGALALSVRPPPGERVDALPGLPTVAAGQTEQVPPHREPPPPPPPPPPAATAAPAPAATTPPAPRPRPQPRAAPAPAAATRNIDVYRGLGAWVDLYDYVLRDHIDPVATVDALARHRVKTLYLQTSKWNIPGTIHDPATVTVFLDRAHAKNIFVVAWYVPGFGDLDRDIQRSVGALEFSTPAGNRFDGFAPDIEDRREVGGDQARFNAGIAEYSRRLRAAVPNGTALGGIVVDAKNNERAPAKWAGFPWQTIGQTYDVILPMAYWSVTKSRCATTYDVEAYMNDVVAKTQALMGRERPMHLIGGIADCISGDEVAAFVRAGRRLGAVGLSLYDFATTDANGDGARMWRELRSEG